MVFIDESSKVRRRSLWLLLALAAACGTDGERLDSSASQEDEDESPELSDESGESPQASEKKKDTEPSENEKSDGTPKESPEDDPKNSPKEESKEPTPEEKSKDSSPKKPKAMPKTKAELCDALEKNVQDTVSGKEVVNWWEQFVDGYPGREFRGKRNGEAAEYLRSQLEDLGYETEILQLNYKGRQVRVVQGLMSGDTLPSEYTVIGAHYDHVKATPSGAYDNASGVATVMTICTQLSKASLRRSHACLFFDAEENGLWGSAAWVQRFVKQKSEDKKVVQMFGFDMAGINWPGKTEWPLNGTVGLPKSMRSKLMEPHATTIETVLLECVGDEIGMKREGLKVLRYYDKSSDEISFMHGGVPIIRFFGGRKATDYPYYHRSGDTKEGVYKVAGGRENFEMGIEMAIKSSYYTILAFDLLDPLNAQVLK